MATKARPVLEVQEFGGAKTLRLRGSRGGIRHTYATVSLPDGHTKEDFRMAVLSCLITAGLATHEVEGV